MDMTPGSLLERLRQPADPQAWGRLVDLYTPLLYAWARRLGVMSQDIPDLVQDVLTVLVQKLPEFTLDPHKRFRGWLWTILRNKWSDDCRRRRAAPPEAAGACLAELPGRTEDADAEAVEYRHYIVGRALRLMQADFQPGTWKACWEYVVNARPPAEVAAELGLSIGAVYVARSRVLARLRLELASLLD